MTLDRRELLKLATALSAAGSLPWLAGCSPDQPPQGAPFSLWRQLRTTLRASPDHLAYRAADAAESGDPETILRFVRDAIRLRPWTVPTHAVQIRDAGHAGLRGVLRSGVASPREKAELLAKLLADAGFKAEIVDGDVDYEALGGDARYLKQDAPPFLPNRPEAPLDDWLAALNLKPRSASPRRLDARQLDELSNKLLATVPVDERARTHERGAVNRWLPLVRFERDGESVYANPNVRDARLGEHYCSRPPRPSPQQNPVAAPELRMSVSIARRGTPNRGETILSGAWPIGELIGRRVQLRFLPTLDPADMLAMPQSQIRQFLPTLMVAGADVTEADAERFGKSGDAFTVDGDRLTDSNGQPGLNGKSLPLGDTDPSLAAEVAAINLDVNASQYPRLTVEAGLQRADGTPLNGLPLSVFSLRHGDLPLSAMLLRNLPEPPRIAIALDFSTSLPDEFEGPALAPIVERMCRAVLARRPDATFRAGSFSGAGIGNAVEWFSGWSADATAVAASVAAQQAGSARPSTYFQALADATNGDANLVLLVTDADGGDAERPEYVSMISAGCPAVIAGLRSALTRDEHFARLAALSGGHLYLDDLDAAADAVVELADAPGDRPYRFDVVVDPGTDPELTLAVPAAGTNQSVRYTPPAEPTANARGIASLHLTVEIDRQSTTRRIAGRPMVSPSVVETSDAHVDDVRHALLGKYDLSIEAGAPTAAAALDDVLSAYLSNENLVTASATRDAQTILDAAAAGVDRLPQHWLTLNAPLPGGDDQFSFQAGYRLILFGDRPDPAGHYRRDIDILPFCDWHSVAPGTDEFAVNLRHSLQMTLLEAMHFDTNTIAAVQDTNYERTPALRMTSWANQLDDEAQKRFWQIAAGDRGQRFSRRELLLPLDPARPGYWEIDTATGAVLGMLPDGSGGATVADTNRKFEMLMQVIDAYSEIMDALSAAPPGFQIWVALEKAKLEHLRRATIAIILMDGTYTSGYGDLLAEQIEGWITDKIEGTIDEALGEVLPGYSEAGEVSEYADKIESLWGSITGIGG